MHSDSTNPGSPRWLHALAVLTVLCTLPLLFFGAAVTTHGVGMVDPRGFRWPWEIVRGLMENNGLAWVLEYGHRTLGFLVGLCGIAFAVGCFLGARKPWLRWFGCLPLAMICAQGALGIFRVDLNALHGREFAMVHGMFAQLVLAVLIGAAVLTSRRWAREPAEEASPALKRWSIVTALLVFGQLLLGGMVRHQDSWLGPRGHLLGAFVVVGAVVWLLRLMRESERFGMERISFMALLGLQLVLGMESWLAKFNVAAAVNHEAIPAAPMHAEWIRTAHYVVGSLIFATSVSVAILAQRRPAAVAAAMEPAPETMRELEGAL